MSLLPKNIVHLVLVKDSRRAISLHEDRPTAEQEIKDLKLIDPKTEHVVESWYVLPRGHSLVASVRTTNPRQN